MLFFRSGLFEVGPESAGAHPGPACYKKNGPLAVTDANLALGRLLPEYFPKIFGPIENEPLDKSRTMQAFQILTNQVRSVFVYLFLFLFIKKSLEQITNSLWKRLIYR